MRRSRGRVGFVAVTALLGSLVVAAVAAGDAAFSDPSGDATGGAPDITRVAVSNDFSGMITFKLTTVAPIVEGSLVDIDLDTDNSPANGAEYGILAGVGGAGMVKWDGTQYVESKATITYARSGNVVELRVGRSDIGNPTHFGFAALTLLYSASDELVGEDSAPDGGEYTYALTFAQCGNGKDDDGDGKVDAADLGCSSETDNRESDDPVSLRAGKVRVTPARPKAGKAFVVSVPMTRAETGRGIVSGKAKCVGRVGARALRGVGTVAAGRASCAFTLPPAARGQAVRGTVTVTYLRKAKVVRFSFRAG
jgi:hypothetical protein